MLSICFRVLQRNLLGFGKQLLVLVPEEGVLEEPPAVCFHAALGELLVGDRDAGSQFLATGDIICINRRYSCGFSSHVHFEK